MFIDARQTRLMDPSGVDPARHVALSIRLCLQFRDQNQVTKKIRPRNPQVHLNVLPKFVKKKKSKLNFKKGGCMAETQRIGWRF